MQGKGEGYLSKRAEVDAARANSERKKVREVAGGPPEAGVEGGTAQSMLKDLLPNTGSLAMHVEDVKGDDTQPEVQFAEEQYLTPPPSPVEEQVVE
jgi:hypothetical protein